MRRIRSALGFALCLACCAGPTLQSGGFTLDKKHTERSFELVRNRAAFELRCPKEQLQLVVLNVRPDMKDAPSQIGVEGCDARAVYIPSYDGWIMNTENTMAKR